MLRRIKERFSGEKRIVPNQDTKEELRRPDMALLPEYDLVTYVATAHLPYPKELDGYPFYRERHKTNRDETFFHPRLSGPRMDLAWESAPHAKNIRIALRRDTIPRIDKPVGQYGLTNAPVGIGIAFGLGERTRVTDSNVDVRLIKDVTVDFTPASGFMLGDVFSMPEFAKHPIAPVILDAARRGNLGMSSTRFTTGSDGDSMFDFYGNPDSGYAIYAKDFVATIDFVLVPKSSLDHARGELKKYAEHASARGKRPSMKGFTNFRLRILGYEGMSGYERMKLLDPHIADRDMLALMPPGEWIVKGGNLQLESGS